MHDACNYVFQGDGKVLVDACDVKYDCAGKVICDKGFCATSMTKGADQPCSNPGEVCATGNYCTVNTAGLLVCTAKAMTGATCSATIPCLETLRCSGGTCTDRVAAGAAARATTTARPRRPTATRTRATAAHRGCRSRRSRRRALDYGGT